VPILRLEDLYVYRPPVPVWNAREKFTGLFVYLPLGFMQRNDAVVRLHDIAHKQRFRNRYPCVTTRTRQEETASTGDIVARGSSTH
jgi:hypothetical protein